MGTLKTILVSIGASCLNLGFGSRGEIIEWQPGKKLDFGPILRASIQYSRAAAITGQVEITYSFFLLQGNRG